VAPVPATLQSRPEPNRNGLLKAKGPSAPDRRKDHLRRIGARTIDALWKAVGEICDLFNPGECWNFLKAAGYGSD
jgi:hypothetical protein